MAAAVGILAGVGALFLGGYALVAFFRILDWRERRRQQAEQLDKTIEKTIERILAEGDSR